MEYPVIGLFVEGTPEIAGTGKRPEREAEGKGHLHPNPGLEVGFATDKDRRGGEEVGEGTAEAESAGGNQRKPSRASAI